MGFGGGANSGPSAGETGSENRKTAQYNTELSFVDQYTPDGSFIYTKIQDGDGDNIPPRYRLDTNLSAAGQQKQQGMDDIQLSLLGIGKDKLGAVKDAMNLPRMDATQSRETATQNAMKYLTYGMDERYATQQSDMQNQLAAQGIRPGSTAYATALKDFNTDKSSAYERAGLQAYNSGLQEMQNMTQLEAYNRSLPLNELTALISGTQVNGPQFTPVQTAQVAQQPYYQGGGQGNSWGSDLLGLGGSLGAAAIMGAFCSRALKDSLHPAEAVLDKVKALPIDRWRYKASLDPQGVEHVGPYAEDWNAAFGGPEPMKINLIDAVGVLLKAVQEVAAEVDELKKHINTKEQ